MVITNVKSSVASQVANRNVVKSADKFLFFIFVSFINIKTSPIFNGVYLITLEFELWAIINNVYSC